MSTNLLIRAEKMSATLVDPHVRYAEIDDRVVALQVRRDAYHVLDPLGSALFRHAARGAIDDSALATLAQEYGCDLSQIRADAARFVLDCQRRELLMPHSLGEASPQPAKRAPPKPHQRTRCAWTFLAWRKLIQVSRRLSRQGFASLYDELSHADWPCPPSGDLQVQLAKAVSCFGRAENFVFLKRAPRDCLPRSLALFAFLREVGLPAEHCIGVRLFPFQAHAWVRCLGRVVRDSESVETVYTTIARITP